ncbi:hypothetical protein [Paenibacillus sp. MABNR03]|uniref:hypothetical protein n=1 Tax=Paenibacillus sp. MABNR03 TaxID=3142626 RepID=UPI003D289B6C
MADDLYRKLVPFFLKKDLVQVAAQFFISGIIGVIYGCMLIDETIGGTINKVLPSSDGPDLHLYLPVVIIVLIYTYFIQKKERIFLEKISFSCLHIIIAIISCFSSCVVLLLI